jgi:AcrR family transcriptional regulator
MKRRDRERTEERILSAVGKELAKSGFRALGVNAIARRARVDKALIYRYFGGLDGLLSAFAESERHWPSLVVIAKEVQDVELSPAEFARHVIFRFIADVRQNRILQEIMRWELSQKSSLADVLAAHRERDAEALLALAMTRFPNTPADVDVPAVTAVLAAGLTLLLLRAATYPDYNGIAVSTVDGWARLERAVESMLGAVLRGPAA